MFASLLPAGRLYHLLDALHQPAARHAQPVDRRRVGFDGKLFAIGCRVQSQLFGNFIELALEGVARLRGAVAAFGSTGGFIGVEPHTIKLVRGNLIGDGEQRASIIDRCQAIAGIGAAVEEGLEVNGGDRAVLLHASFEQHLDGMASAMTVEDLFATERIFDGPPMKYTLSREEVFYCHRGRHPVKMLLKTGVKQDGTITAVHLQTFLDGGAYASYGLATVYYTGALLTVTYKIPAYKFDGMRLYTNKPACGPKRGHGSTQPRYAFECQLDKIAEQLGLDPAAYRKQLAIEPYSTTVNGLRVTSCGLVECVEKVVEASGWQQRRKHLPTGHGLGVAISSYVTGAGKAIYWNDMPHSGVIVKIDRGGGVAVLCGSSDIGQGSDTMLAQVVAAELGIDVLDIRVYAGDTDLTPVDLGSYSSRVTFMAGNAAREAAQKLRTLLIEAASTILDVPSERLTAGSHRIFCADEPEKGVSFIEAAQQAEATHGTLSAVGSYTPPKLGGEFKGAGVGISPAYSYTACVAEVQVDPETYDVKVEKLWVAHDCGRALNPTLVEGQVEGSAYMGFGEAVLEEQVFRKGLHKIPSLLEYKLPTIYDTPDIISMTVETLDKEGPYGAKEAGEGPLNPIIPAIANAVYDAIGARVDSTPITPDKIARALKSPTPGPSPVRGRGEPERDFTPNLSPTRRGESSKEVMPR